MFIKKLPKTLQSERLYIHMYRLNIYFRTLDTCELLIFQIVDDVSPWVLASEGRLAAKRSNGKVHVACGRACIGRALRWHGMWRYDGMKNIKRSTITTTHEKPNLSSNLSIKRVVSRSRRQKYNSTLNWYKNSTKVRAQKVCDMLRYFPKQTSFRFMDSNIKWNYRKKNQRLSIRQPLLS